ncbi:hypothetical protein AB5J49_43170 [Streptomyces sp. R28]|uniref:Uncharacterized protein n=1 Tax=Streptomyces sp. R28 TaxID=3238628 RepID=A0AB39QB69_9ACTN
MSMRQFDPGDALTIHPFVGGTDVEVNQWVHTISARAMIDDPRGSLLLRRRLDTGREPAADIRQWWDAAAWPIPGCTPRR